MHYIAHFFRKNDLQRIRLVGRMEYFIGIKISSQLVSYVLISDCSKRKIKDSMETSQISEQVIKWRKMELM